MKIILGTLLDTHKASVDPEFNARVSEFNRRLILTACDMTTVRSPIVIAATHAEFVASAHTWDGTHPNGDGELRIAAAFADTLAGQFGRGRGLPAPVPEGRRAQTGDQTGVTVTGIPELAEQFQLVVVVTVADDHPVLDRRTPTTPRSAIRRPVPGSSAADR